MQQPFDFNLISKNGKIELLSSSASEKVGVKKIRINGSAIVKSEGLFLKFLK